MKFATSLSLLVLLLVTSFRSSMPRSTGTSHAHCVVGGTQILTPDGLTSVEKLKMNDIIITLNERNNRFEQSKILSFQINTKQQTYELDFSGTTITVSADHPFYYKGAFYSIQPNSLYGASSLPLKVGQKVLLIENDRWVEKPLLKIKKSKKKVTTYAITKVSSNRLYFTNGICSLIETIPTTFAVNHSYYTPLFD